MKKRLDVLLAQRLNVSRNKAKNLIDEGLVKIEGKIADKSSLLFDEEIEIVVSEHKDYVSRGAFKLLKAIETFDFSFDKKVVVDVGASTGGFTQVALEHGAKKVYSIDVGKGELDSKLKGDSRVVNMEGRDIRSITIDEVKDAQIIIGDLSFISLKHILPKINELFGKIECILLFKPQFECGKQIASKYKGVIKDKIVHRNLLKELNCELEMYNFNLSDVTYSPIKGKSGNIEYLLHLNGENIKNNDINKIINDAFRSL